MNYKKITALFSACILAAALTACGKENTPAETSDTPAISDVTDESTADDEAETSEDLEESEPVEKTTSAKDKEKDSSEKTESTKSKSDKKSAETTATSKDGKISSGGSGNSSGNGSSGGSGNSDKKQETTKARGNSGNQTATTPADESGSKYDAEISFDGGVSVKGANAAADGSVVRITAGGDYIVRGSTSDGQIYVNTPNEEKVEITLENVNISCSDGPAIFIDNAKKCVIKLAGGSSNYLSDGGKDKVNDGVIFSNDTLRIKGGGSLEIKANNAHGIASDDDIIIENGVYNITSIKSGLFAHDDITINGGELSINGGTNGIKSKGTVNINGGASWITGGVKEEKSSVYAAAGLYYRGGYVYAVGNTVTAPTETPNPYVVVNWANGMSADTTVGFVLNGTQYAEVTSHNPFKCAMMLAPDITIGSTYAPCTNGEYQGDHEISEGLNLITIE